VPISLDLDHLTAPFRSLARRDLTVIAEAFERLGQWLNARVKQADRLDDASRGFPVIHLYNEAVSTWVDEIQYGALAPPPTLGEQLRRAGGAFLSGVRRVPEAIDEARILPRFLSTVNAALDAVFASLVRFETPTAETFDPRARKASDLFGEAALAFRALKFSRPQVETFLFRQLGPALKILGGDDGEKEKSLDLPDQLERVTHVIVGALLILSTLPQLLASLWTEVKISARAQIIAAFARLEESAHALRRSIIHIFYVDLENQIERAAAYVAAAGDILADNLRFWERFARIYATVVLIEIGVAGDKITEFIHAMLGWLTDKFLFLEFFKMDITPLIMGILGGPAGALLSQIVPLPTITLWDLVTGAASALLTGFIQAAKSAVQQVDRFDLLGIQERLDALATAVGIAATPLTEKLVEGPRIPPPPTFPSVFDLWFTTSSADTLQGSYRTLATQVPEELSDVFSTASAAFGRAGILFDQLADRSARGGSLEQLADISNTAAQTAETAFGPEAEALRKTIETSALGSVALNFEHWLARGGIMVVGAVVPQYVGAMIATWREQEASGEELTALLNKTSPHILAEKAELARARMQHLTIVARGHALDDALADAIAEQFRSAMSAAFEAGNQQIRDLAHLTVG
jgi:hypothetical protein